MRLGWSTDRNNLPEGEYVYRLLSRQDSYECSKKRVPALLLILGVIFIPFILSIYLIDNSLMIDFSTLIMQSTLGLSNDALAITLGIVFGFAGLAAAVYFGSYNVIKDFLTESKKAQIDEKIAMLYNYADVIRGWSDNNLAFPPYMINRMESDIRSIGRIRRSIKDEQLEDLSTATNALMAAMQPRYGNETRRVEIILRAYYLW